MGRTIVYIATSLDGFIARNNDDVSWLDPFNEGGEDYGFTEFMKSVGTAVMGFRTYEQSLLHPERLLTGIKNYVVTRRSRSPAPAVDMEFWHGSLKDLISRIRQESNKDIYLVGGGRMVSAFIDEGLVDEIYQFVVPVLLNDGIPLYSGLRHEIRIRLVDVVPYASGIVRLRYSVREPLPA